MSRTRVNLALHAILLFALSTSCESIIGVSDRVLAVCSPGASLCSGGKRKVCVDEGKRWQDDPCTAHRPLCRGAGECVECIEADGTKLPDPTSGDCQALVCEGGIKAAIADDEDVGDDACVRVQCDGGAPTITPTAAPGKPCELWRGAPSESSCARDVDGNVRCWGRNDQGQLGLGTSDLDPHPVPALVKGLPPVRHVSLGDDYACALLRDGTVRCWGNNAYGKARGMLGDPPLTPTEVVLPALARQIATGANDACAALVDGTLECWGLNHFGQLGNGTTLDPSPVGPVMEDATTPLAGVMSIAVGGHYACAILAGGNLRCWGEDAEIGAAIDEDAGVYPTLYAGVSSVSCGTEHSCLATKMGTVSCWGQNGFGETGDGTTLNNDPPVTLLPQFVFLPDLSLGVAASYRHSCSRGAKGVWCWGGDFWGQLGDGNGCAKAMCSPQPFSFVPVAVHNLGATDDLALGWVHSCVIAKGIAYCWGKNLSGQLGDGTTVGSDVPTQVLWK